MKSSADKHLFLSSNPLDIFYLTHKNVFKEKLLYFNSEFRLLENEEEIIRFVNEINPDYLEVDFSKTTHKEFLKLEKLFPKLTIKNGNPITQMRKIKKVREIELLKKSAELNQKAMEFVVTNLKPGMEEIEVCNLYERFIKDHGAIKVAFDPICSFSNHTANVHHRPTHRRLEKGDLVTLDFGCILNYYASDMTRSFRFEDSRISDFEKVVNEAHRLALSMCKPDMDFKTIQKAVDEYFEKHGFGKYRKHSIGHGVGLEVHEEPFVLSEDTILKEGMLITIEPGLYNAGVEGYRHEDTLLITKTGFENLYESWNWPR
jgi:Xaa-Pro aminopeptidase